MVKSDNYNFISITGILSVVWLNVTISGRRTEDHETPEND
jgi:hypothetical protein